MIKRFLGIGINNYPSSPLNGCIPDIALAYKVAKSVFKFNDFNILDDAKATKKNILDAMKKALRGLTDNDMLYIHYSGHGSYQPCDSFTASSETDFYDEGWVPYDYETAGLLIDNEINRMVKTLDPDVNLLICSDSCFSGSVVRLNSPKREYKNRFIPPPLHLLLNSGELDLDEYLNPKITKKDIGSTKLKSFIVDTKDKQNNAILISGCGEHQTSADVYIPEAKTYHGALTYNLFQILKESNWNMTYEKLILEVNNRLSKEDYEQKPQLECNAKFNSTKFLGGIS
jgi:metacaspase-1